jgi:hypothetical protein
MSPLPVRGNTLGVIMFVAAGLVAGLGGLLLRLPDVAVLTTVGLALTGADLTIRAGSRANPGWLTRSEFGGYFFFMPVWVVGLLVVVVNLALLWLERSGR